MQELSSNTMNSPMSNPMKSFGKKARSMTLSSMELDMYENMRGASTGGNSNHSSHSFVFENNTSVCNGHGGNSTLATHLSDGVSLLIKRNISDMLEDDTHPATACATTASTTITSLSSTPSVLMSGISLPPFSPRGGLNVPSAPVTNSPKVRKSLKNTRMMGRTVSFDDANVISTTNNTSAKTCSTTTTSNSTTTTNTILMNMNETLHTTNTNNKGNYTPGDFVMEKSPTSVYTYVQKTDSNNTTMLDIPDMFPLFHDSISTTFGDMSGEDISGGFSHSDSLQNHSVPMDDFMHTDYEFIQTCNEVYSVPSTHEKEISSSPLNVYPSMHPPNGLIDENSEHTNDLFNLFANSNLLQTETYPTSKPSTHYTTNMTIVDQDMYRMDYLDITASHPPVSTNTYPSSSGSTGVSVGGMCIHTSSLMFTEDCLGDGLIDLLY